MKNNTEIQSIDRLAREYYNKNPDGHYFDRDTLKFFGEAISRMYLYKNLENITDISGEKHICYCIRKEGKDFLGKKRVSYGYFF